ncbi:PHP domain-containing protein [Paenibacillus sp. TRM 82003]|nr:PHP domain-containing protein [Paenibacillus sp. TRM 82003]
MAVTGSARYDLHAHTTASDGQLTPAELVALARDAGLSGVAITDHDTVAGVEEALEAGAALGVDVIPGVEISATGQDEDIHVLGLWVDPSNPRFLERLERNRDVRKSRNVAMIEALRGLGFDVTLEEAEAIALERRGGDDRSVSRPHIAELLLRKGCVSSVADAFARLIGNDGPAYVSVERVHPDEAMKWIQEAGGVAVLAHPGLYRDAGYWIERMSLSGLDGIEAAHADHDERLERRYRFAADLRGLVATAGSDFHGYRGKNPFHAGLGSKFVGKDVVVRLLARRTERGRNL